MRTALEIPLHRLDASAPLGIVIHAKDTDSELREKASEAHRDDHYTFGFLESGRVDLMIDFESVAIMAGSAFVLLPGQVHQLLSTEHGQGWIMAMDAALVSDLCRTVFEPADGFRSIPLRSDQIQQFRDCARLLHTLHGVETQSPLHIQTVRQLASAYAGMMAAVYSENNCIPDRAQSRYGVITQSFRQLLSQNYKEDKSPAGYADRLNLSVNYLNEAVRAETGLPVRHWIQHTVMLEAKRLLYYTPLSVKEVAHTLGYDDHAYFTRLFTKVTGASPVAFRRRKNGKVLQEKYA